MPSSCSSWVPGQHVCSVRTPRPELDIHLCFEVLLSVTTWRPRSFIHNLEDGGCWDGMFGWLSVRFQCEQTDSSTITANATKLTNDFFAKPYFFEATVFPPPRGFDGGREQHQQHNLSTLSKKTQTAAAMLFSLFSATRSSKPSGDRELDLFSLSQLCVFFYPLFLEPRGTAVQISMVVVGTLLNSTSCFPVHRLPLHRSWVSS